MKKKSRLLAFMCVVICLSLILSACFGDDGQQTVEEDTTSGNDQQIENDAEKNLQKLLSELNKGENVADMLKMLEDIYDSVDCSGMISELGKVSGKLDAKVDLTEDGEKLGDLSGSAIIKDNNYHFEMASGEEKYGVDAKITDSLIAAFAVWGNTDGNVDVINSNAIDLSKLLEVSTDNALDSVSSCFGSIGNLEDIKLSQFKPEHFTYKDGKYILSNDFFISVIDDAVDSVIDAMKNSGNNVTSDVEEQVREIIDTVKNVINSVDFELYYVVNYEVLEGMGVKVNAEGDKIAQAIGAESEAPFDYLKLELECGIKREYVNFEYKANDDDHVNKILCDVKFIFDGDIVCGVDAALDIDIINKEVKDGIYDVITGGITISPSFKSGSSSSYGFISGTIEDEDGYRIYTEITKFSGTALIDLSKFGSENSTVASIDIDAHNESSCETFYVSGTSKKEVYSDSTYDVVASVKTSSAYNATVSMKYVENYSRYPGSEEFSSVGTYNIEATGSIAYTNENVTFPALDSTVENALNEAIKNPLDSFVEK